MTAPSACSRSAGVRIYASVTDQSHSVDQPISPTAQAADARAKAARLEGRERDYWLWLAGEWDRTATREVHPLRRAPNPFVDLHP
jgi:hypothetical protein